MKAAYILGYVAAGLVIAITAFYGGGKYYNLVADKLANKWTRSDQPRVA